MPGSIDGVYGFESSVARRAESICGDFNDTCVEKGASARRELC